MQSDKSRRCPSENALDKVPFEDSDQTARIRRLILVVTGRLCILVENAVLRLNCQSIL